MGIKYRNNVHAHARAHTHTHAHTRTDTHRHRHTHTHTHTHTDTHTHTHTHTQSRRICEYIFLCKFSPGFLCLKNDYSFLGYRNLNMNITINNNVLPVAQVFQPCKGITFIRTVTYFTSSHKHHTERQKLVRDA